MSENPVITKVAHNMSLRQLFFSVVLLNVLVVSIVWYALQTSKSHHEEQARIATVNISRVLDENITGVLSKVDIALQSVTDEAERQLKDGAIEEDLFDRFITRQHSRLPELTSLRATNAAGEAVYGPHTNVARTISLSHRDYFIFLRDTMSADMVISKPLIGGISGKWMIILSRRINRPDNSFAGLAYAGLGLDYLTQSFKELNIGTHGSITLLDSDFNLVARYPEPKIIGAEVGRKVTYSQLVDLVKAGKATGNFKAVSSADGIERTYAFCRLSHNQPFYLVTELSTDDYLDGWRSESFVILLFYVIFLLSTVIAAWLIYREWARTREAQHQLGMLNSELEERVKDRSAAAEKSNQILQSIVDTMSDFLWEIDRQGRYTFCSPQIEKVLGYTPEEVAGKSLFTFMSEEDAEQIRGMFEEVSRHKARIKSLEHCCIARDGNIVLLSSNAVPILDADGSLTGYRGVDTDITVTRQAENELRESNNRFYSTFNNAPIMMAISNLEDGRCVSVNQRFIDISGFTRDEVVGKSFIDIGLISASERQKIVDAMMINRQVYDLDLNYTAKSGKKMIWRFSGQMIQLGGKEYLLSSAMDITEHRLIEQQLMQSQKLEAIGYLAGGIAHDFNNKLMVILGCADLARMDIEEPDRVLEYLSEITIAADHSRLVTTQLLGFSRQQVVMPVVLDINNCLRETQKTLPRLIGEKVSCVFKSGKDLWNIHIDPVQFDQIIMNMAVNARDAMPSGGRFTIETRNVNLDATLRRMLNDSVSDEYVCISFSDTGIGIDQDALRHIFEPFFTTKEQGKGTGLGLATIHGIVSQSRGHIEVQSSPGHGTVFSVYLPRHTAMPDKVTWDESAYKTGTGAILLVEDEDPVRDMAAKFLERIGYTTYVAETPGEALRIVSDETIHLDLVLTDVIMPEMNGTELVSRIREIRPDIKAVFASGYSSGAADLEIVAKEGTFLQKPYDLKGMSILLHRILTEREAG